jgi:hypothetical protein
MLGGMKILRQASRVEPLERRTHLAGDGPAPLRLNAGGAALVDSIGRAFLADSGFVGGQMQQSSAANVLDTTDDALFLSYRAGTSFTFSHAVTNGHYALWLEFAEPVYTEPGQRQFDVSAEGVQVLNDFDIVQAAGAKHTAIARSFDVAVEDGSIDLSFNGVVGEAIVAAIVLIATDVPAEAAPYSWQALHDAQRFTLSQAHLRTIGQGIMFYATENRGDLPRDLPTVRATQEIVETHFGNPRTSTRLPRGEISDLEGVAWVRARNDYIYLGGGLRARDLTDGMVLAYENPDRQFGDIAVLWGDMHVSSMSRASAAALIGFPNAPPSDPPPAPPPLDPPDPAIVTSAARMHQLREAMIEYSHYNRGLLPVDFGTLYQFGLVTDLNLFVNPRGTTQLPPDDATEQQKIAWVNSTRDYLMAAPGQSSTRFDISDALLVENPQGMIDGINVLLGDWRIEFREMRWADETLRRQRPGVQWASFSYNEPKQSYAIGFDGPGIDITSIQPADLVLLNLTTQQTIPASAMAFSYHVNFRRVEFTFPGLPYGALPDGNYRATLLAGSVADPLGNPLGTDFSFEFFHLAGDANRDRVVDAADLGILASNWQQNFRHFSHGDFDYSGIVDVADLGILAGNWQQALPEPGAAVAIPVRRGTQPRVAAKILW